MRLSSFLGCRVFITAFTIVLSLLAIAWLRNLRQDSPPPHPARALAAVTNTTLGFEKVLVLGLPDRLDKKDVWALACIASDLQIEWIDGTRGEDISPKALPAGWRAPSRPNVSFGNISPNGTLGSFRGHLDAIRRIIENRYTTALILEDDVDWDVMLRQQLLSFAKAARYIQHSNSNDASPYGDSWDLLLLGHCSAESRIQTHLTSSTRRFWTIHDDPTVMPSSLYKWIIPSEQWQPELLYPSQKGKCTRTVYEASRTRCTYAYAFTLWGAQRFLYRFSLEANSQMLDYAVSDFCSDTANTCITAFPGYFDQYHPAGLPIKDSDRYEVQKDADLLRQRGVTDNIVFPRKAGLGTYVSGGHVYESQWADETLWSSVDVTRDVLPVGQGHDFDEMGG